LFSFQRAHFNPPGGILGFAVLIVLVHPEDSFSAQPQLQLLLQELRGSLLQTAYETRRDLRELPKCANTLSVASNTYWA
jgi:hypothetical protein